MAEVCIEIRKHDQSVHSSFLLHADHARTSSFALLKFDPHAPVPPEGQHTETGWRKRLDFLQAHTGTRAEELGALPDHHRWESLSGHIENFVGYSTIPLGVAGPLCVAGEQAKRTVYVPLATTEGALVASYQRGMLVTSQSGGITARSVSQEVSRCPLFRFACLEDALQFVGWATQQTGHFHELIAGRSHYARLQKVEPLLEGNEVWLSFRYTTGDAAGQNMVTLCTEAICTWMVSQCPVPVAKWFLDGNLSGDKKATQSVLTRERGHRAIAECRIPAPLLSRWLNVTPPQMAQCWQGGVLGAIQSGASGALAHAANGLAALFIATGQDVACVAEAANGVLRMEAQDEDELYASVTLPNLIVGTVGGGTHFPTAQNCLHMLGCAGSGKATELAEIAAATVLAGELSLTAAIASGHFGRAHALLGRKREHHKP